MKVFVTRTLPEDALAPLQAMAEVEVWPTELPPAHPELVARAPGLDGILTLLTDPIDAAFVAAAHQLRIVSQMAVGYDNIDVAACTARGIRVANTPGVLTETTADLAFALIMAAGRRIVEADTFTRAGRWQTWAPFLLAGRDIHHATLGIVGMGRIGYEVARRAHGFQMPILYTSNRPNEAAERDFGALRTSLDDLLARSDYVSLHTPLNPGTRGLIGKKQLALMKPTAILVNTARGPVVDQAALAEALTSGAILAAGIDVFESEPVPMDDPLLQLPNVVVLPHIGSASVETRTRMTHIAVDNLMAGLEGRTPPFPVN